MKNMWSEESSVWVWLFMPPDPDFFFSRKISVHIMHDLRKDKYDLCPE
jgi:hypothetical protein